MKHLLFEVSFLHNWGPDSVSVPLSEVSLTVFVSLAAQQEVSPTVFCLIGCSTIWDHYLEDLFQFGTVHSQASWPLAFDATICQDVAGDLCRSHVPFVRCDKECADLSTNNVTNLRDVIDVPVPVLNVEDSSLHVPSLFSDEPFLELSRILN